MLGIRGKNIEPTKAVCRALFGPIDHKEVRKALGKELTRIENENNERWNFNFQSETPITGKFTWVKLTEADDVPVAYKMLMNLQQMIQDRREMELSRHQNQSENTTELALTTEETEVVAAPPVRQSRKRKLSIQCQITEYFPHKRKMARLEKSLH